MPQLVVVWRIKSIIEALIESMAQNEYRADAEKKKRGVYGVSDTTSILANQAAMNKQIEAWWDKTASARPYRSSNKESIIPIGSWSIQST